jgi:hypothetical protein
LGTVENRSSMPMPMRPIPMFKALALLAATFVDVRGENKDT